MARRERMTAWNSTLRARRRVVATLADRASAPARRALADEHREQLERFADLAPRFADRYRTLADDAPATTAPWQRYVVELEQALLPVPPTSFLRLPVVMETMLPHSARARRLQLAYLRSREDDGALARLLREDPVGDPVLVRPYPTSANRVHVLAHVERFAEVTDVDPASIASVVEWGGGYGAMCRVWRLLGTATYTILDLPIALCLQWLYLASVLGEDAVVLHERPGSPGARARESDAGGRGRGHLGRRPRLDLGAERVAAGAPGRDRRCRVLRRAPHAARVPA